MNIKLRRTMFAVLAATGFVTASSHSFGMIVALIAASVLYVMAYEEKARSESREMQILGDWLVERDTLTSRIKYLEDNQEFWKNLAKSKGGMSSRSHMTADGDFKFVDVSMVANPPPGCELNVSGIVGIKSTRRNGRNVFMEAWEMAQETLMDGVIVPGEFTPKKKSKKIYPEILAHTIGCAPRMNLDDPVTETELQKRIAKCAKDTNKFVNDIEEAHKNAAHSTLVFGPDSKVDQREKE